VLTGTSVPANPAKSKDIGIVQYARSWLQGPGAITFIPWPGVVCQYCETIIIPTNHLAWLSTVPVLHLANPVSMARCENDLGYDQGDSSETPRIRTSVGRLIHSGPETTHENRTRGENPKIRCDQHGHELSEGKKRIL
jgi:hypothetical protein